MNKKKLALLIISSAIVTIAVVLVVIAQNRVPKISHSNIADVKPVVNHNKGEQTPAWVGNWENGRPVLL
jgi:hypothetical protein